MTKAELILEVARKSNLPVKQATAAVNATLEVIRDELINGGEVNLIGFGKFSVKERAARKGHNPRTGEDLTIPAHKLPTFTAGKSLKQAVNHD